jgi:nitrogen regulatory protein PII
MSERIYLTDVAMIHCIINAGTADRILLAARDMGARHAIIHHARGWGIRERLGVLGVAVETEKEVVSILVSSDQQDVVFEALYRAGNFDLPGRGLIYITPLEQAATYGPKGIRDRLDLDEGAGE